MSNIESLTSLVQQLTTSVKLWNDLRYIFVGATAIFTVLSFLTFWVSGNKTDLLSKTKDELTQIKDKDKDLRLAKVKTDSEENIERVKIEAEKQIALLSAEASKSKEEIAKAQAQSSQADAEAARANEKAEAERLIRVKMEADLAPRIITINEGVINELKIFSGTNVFIQVEPYDIEANRLAGQIYNMLINSGWNILGVTPKKPSTTGITIFGKGNTIIYGETGVMIYSKRTGTEKDGFLSDSNKWNDAAKILSYRLEIDNKIKAIQYTLRPQSAAFPPDFPDNAVLVAVGSKPQPYFQDKQRLESLAQSGMLKELEEMKRESDSFMEKRMEEDAKKIPSLRKLLEESKQRKESVTEVWQRDSMEKYKEYQKEDRERILRRYK